LGELGDLVVDLSALFHEATDFLDSVDNGGVISSAEIASNGRVTEVGHFPHHVHTDLASSYERPAAALPFDLFDCEIEHFRGLLENQRRCDGPGLGVGEDVAEHPFGQFNREGVAGEAGECADSDKRALELTDVVGDV
jgi:hypothetical protein